ncbi:MAG: helix-turn-helix transcriptional regulator [Lachnospiraceae bacterium]|nr:helix-turn-helix transcriptional regulator [Lachnospiraceae bacterium]
MMMSLGETIYRLRTEKSLSQGDLAEMLEVSRQSISKWENNSAVPDLEKIIRLSEIFEVSLDELVKGEETPRRTATVNNIPQENVREVGFPPRKIAGIILLCMAFLVVMFFLVAGGGLAGLIFALPFLTCGILCFALKKNVGLWCAWDLYVLFDLYMSYATGISRASVLYSFQWTPEMNYMRLAFAWFAVISLAVMIAVTVVRFGKEPFDTEQKGRRKLIGAWAILLLIQAVAMLWPRTNFFDYILANIVSMGTVYQLISIVLSWAKIVAFTVAVVCTSRFIKMKKQK